MYKVAQLFKSTVCIDILLIFILLNSSSVYILGNERADLCIKIILLDEYTVCTYIQDE
jgi:hypothetical protein